MQQGDSAAVALDHAAGKGDSRAVVEQAALALTAVHAVVPFLQPALYEPPVWVPSWAQKPLVQAPKAGAGVPRELVFHIV